MLNYLWGFMLLIGVVYGALTGNLPALTDAALSSAKEAVTLCVTMLGVMSFWMGLMRIAEGAGILSGATRKLTPFLRFLFPRLPREHPANKYIATNMIANIFGLGWAATPAGLKAMEALAELEEDRRKAAGTHSGRAEEIHKNKAGLLSGRAGEVHRDRTGLFSGQSKGVSAGASAMPQGAASNEMCNFLIINISSLQLIPVNIIAYRGQYGSVNPAAIVGPAIAATILSTAAGILFCKVADGRRRP